MVEQEPVYTYKSVHLVGQNNVNQDVNDFVESVLVSLQHFGTTYLQVKTVTLQSYLAPIFHRHGHEVYVLMLYYVLLQNCNLLIVDE